MNDGGPAFPQTMGNVTDEVKTGMSLRDWFAGQALAGECASQSEADGTWTPGSFCDLASRCYLMADAMIFSRDDVPEDDEDLDPAPQP